MPKTIEGSLPEIEQLLAVISLNFEIADSPGPTPEDPGALDALGERYDAATAALAPHIHTRLDSILASLRTTPVDVSTKVRCPLCHVRFSTILESRMLRVSLLFFCPQCRRPLYRLNQAAAPEAAQPPRKEPKRSKKAPSD